MLTRWGRTPCPRSTSPAGGSCGSGRATTTARPSTPTTRSRSPASWRRRGGPPARRRPGRRPRRRPLRGACPDPGRDRRAAGRSVPARRGHPHRGRRRRGDRDGRLAGGRRHARRRDPEAAGRLARATGRIWPPSTAWREACACAGGQTDSGADRRELVGRLVGAGVRDVAVTAIERDGTGAGPDVGLISRLRPSRARRADCRGRRLRAGRRDRGGGRGRRRRGGGAGAL